jgi:hypothetical protein
MFTGLKRSESKRLAALELLRKEDKTRDAALTEYACLACEVMNVEGCFITVFDDDYQYIKYVKNVPLSISKSRLKKRCVSIPAPVGRLLFVLMPGWMTVFSSTAGAERRYSVLCFCADDDARRNGAWHTLCQ